LQRNKQNNLSLRRFRRALEGAGPGILHVQNNFGRPDAHVQRLLIHPDLRGIGPHGHAGFLSNARKLTDTWPEIFRVNPKLLPYDHYRRIAVCSLPRKQKDEIRTARKPP
jgi:hypothetical protein